MLVTTRFAARILAAIAMAATVCGLPAAKTAPAKNSDERSEPINPGDHAFVIRVGDLDRHYTVHVPPSYDGQRPVPVVIMLHGGGGTGRAAAYETGWSAKADQVGFLAVYPEATPPDPTKPSQFRTNGQIWNESYVGKQSDKLAATDFIWDFFQKHPAPK